MNDRNKTTFIVYFKYIKVVILEIELVSFYEIGSWKLINKDIAVSGA